METSELRMGQAFLCLFIVYFWVRTLSEISPQDTNFSTGGSLQSTASQPAPYYNPRTKNFEASGLWSGLGRPARMSVAGWSYAAGTTAPSNRGRERANQSAKVPHADSEPPSYRQRGKPTAGLGREFRIGFRCFACALSTSKSSS